MEKNKLLRELLREKWLFILTFIIIFVPTVLIRLNLYRERSYYESGLAYRYTNYMILYIFAIITAIILPLILFGYLHNKEKIDFYHSLPATRNELFFSKYFRGLVYLSVPYFITVITTSTMDKIFYPDTQILTLTFMLYIVKYWLVIVLVYTIAIIANIICGMSIYSFLCSVFFILSPFVWFVLMRELNLIYYNFFESRPNYSLYDHLMNNVFGDFETYWGLNSNLNYFLVIIALLVILALLYKLALMLYCKRKSESTSTPIALKSLVLPLKVVAVYMVTFFFIFAAFGYRSLDFDEYFIGVIVAMALTLVCEVLISEGLRKLKLKSISITFLISTFVLLGTFAFVKLGIYQMTHTEIPYTDVSRISVNFWPDTEDEFLLNPYSGYFNESYDNTYIVSNMDDIEKTMDLIQRLNDVDVQKEYTKNIAKISEDKEAFENYRKQFKRVHFDVNVLKGIRNYNFLIDTNDEYAMSLYNELYSLDPKESYYQTALNHLDVTKSLEFVQYEDGKKYSSRSDSEYYLKNSTYPVAKYKLDEEFIEIYEETIKKLATLDVSEFDRLPLTEASLSLNNFYFNNRVTITTDAIDLFEYIKIPKQQFEVYDILGSANSKELITEVVAYDKYLSYTFQFRGLNYQSQIIYSLGDAKKLPSFSTDDLIEEKIDVKVYVNQISKEIIEKYDLKLIHATTTDDWYFGTVEVLND